MVSTKICSAIKRFRKSRISSLEAKIELRRANSELCKKVMTLNYVSSMEVNPTVMDNASRIEEMKSFEQELKIEIVKITEKIKIYRSLI
ncbi:MAG: hypothetical protein HKP48_06105 [Winogradskyella sp.]|uniref:hypothetical protein n=1 Tax=Winogradskyella sp. TaxID=1883156 RepID=UPI001858DEE1|nr:hypothetical protein [Winogradskyella sp.]MBT8245092.1 hypothetical protein [Winogradskyella sp.]NNK22867.1 hypothetical protein [Winogradskyella sp.]